DAAHAGGTAASGYDLEDAAVARARDVRTAAELHREIAHAQHADVFVVFFPEQGDRTLRDRRVVRHLARLGHRVLADLLVHEPLDARELGRRDRSEVREVEAQTVRRDERALLLDVGAENLAERGV